MDTITRKEAKSKGLNKYFTGKPCTQGHVSVRYVVNGACIACNLIRMRGTYDKEARYERSRTNKEFRKRELLKGAKYRANKKGLEFNLTVDTVEWPDVCPVLGTELNYFAGMDDRWNQVSIDRTDNRKGYTPDNVVIMSMKANSIKGHHTVEEMEKVLEYMKKA